MGLQINFFKSSHIGVNVDLIFLIFVGDSLNFEIEILPLKYIGLLVAPNPKPKSSWDPLVNLLIRGIYS